MGLRAQSSVTLWGYRHSQELRASLWSGDSDKMLTGVVLSGEIFEY